MSLGEPFLCATSGAIDGILVGAVLAAMGYVAKEIVGTIREWRHEEEQRRARLHRLQALLHASQSVFVVQREQAGRLGNRLRSRYGDELPDDPGLERLFVHFYSRFDPDEKDLHGLIRAYTQHGLRPLNETMQTWLRDDVDHRTSRGKSGKEAELSRQLNQLDAHLLLWLAKYEAWIPNQPEHALVYLGDEEKHGLEFPHGIEDTLAEVLARRG